MKRILLTLLFCGFSHASQPGYEVCPLMMDEAERLKCLEIVRGATRAYPIQLIRFLDGFKLDSNKNLALKAAQDRSFPDGALDACEKLATDDSIKAFLKAIEIAGDVKTKQKKVTTDPLEVFVSDWDTHPKAIARAELIASQKCRGWDFYAFENPKWTTQSCWVDHYSQNVVDYKLVYRQATTSSGRRYDYPTIAPYDKTVYFSRYHCRAKYHCWRWEKDFSEVQ